MSTVAEERADVLPAEPASVGRARRFVASVLEAWGLDGLVSDATLLVSEIVTNAVLHAGTDIDIRVRRADLGVRIEVADGSPVLPAPRRYGDESVTGRGLHILESTAAAWGAVGTRGGKTVWFDVGVPGTPNGSSEEPAPPVDSMVVRWTGLPPRLVKATLEHGDAMLRELMLLSFDEEVSTIAPNPLAIPALDLTDLLAAIDEALASDSHLADIEIAVGPTAADAALSRLALVDEADRMSAEGALLIPAALPEIVACRQWLWGQLMRQTAGEPAVPWEMVEAPRPAPGWEPVTDAELAILGDGVGDSLVVDQENRIVFIGDRAAQVLGWAPTDLLGHRLIDIVPSDLREAHLVGFTRYQLRGQGTLLGEPLQLRARHADGHDVPVVITLDALPRHRGRHRHRARLEAAG